MAAPTTLSALLSSLTQSLASAQEAIPSIASIPFQRDGISLLDVKNELLLSYLQNLVFLILLKLRNARDESDSPVSGLDESVRAKLVELRLYLEKGARPLEEKLQFSIDRFLRTADDAQRQQNSKSQRRKNIAGTGQSSDDEDDGSDSSFSSSSSLSSDEQLSGARLGSKHSARTAAPNIHSLKDDITALPSRAERSEPDGIYRPPRRERQLMEPVGRAKEQPSRRPQRSTTMDEFIVSELSGAPMAEPSVGTNIVRGGAKMKSAAQRKDEDERREYEESNFVRLPKESKKDKAKKAKADGRTSRMMFGGEEFRELGEGVERIDRLTKKRDGGGKAGGVRAMLEKSRKRGNDTIDGPRGNGHGMPMGERFHKRVKILEGGRRDRGKKR